MSNDRPIIWGTIKTAMRGESLTTLNGETPELTPEMMQRIGRLFTAHLAQAIISGAGMTDFTTTATQAPPNADSIRAAIEGAIDRWKHSDPLLSRGILLDWVCVIHPALIKPLLDQTRDLVAYPYSGTPLHLRDITRRETWIMNSAPRDAIEYMDTTTFFTRYAEEFQARIALAKLEAAEKRRAAFEEQLGYAVPDWVWRTWEDQAAQFGSGNGRKERG